MNKFKGFLFFKFIGKIESQLINCWNDASWGVAIKV